MKILIIGAEGTIGRAVFKRLKNNNEILTASRHSSDYQVDISEKNSIRQLFESTGKLDAIICTAGEAKWASLEVLSEQDYYIGIRSKLMGQVNLVRIGLDFLNPNGSITLTTGILADHPVPMTTSAAMVNGALHSFVRALKTEDLKGKRVNVVSAALVEDSREKYADYFKGQPVVSMDEVSSAFKRSIDENLHGEIIKIYGDYSDKTSYV